jgi:hypothetical protein
MPDPTFARSTTRQEMERAGRALPRKSYRCVYACGFRGSHDEMHHHQLDTCELRPGSTVKRPQ